MQSGYDDTLEEWYAIKLWFKLGKKKCHRNVRNASDCFGPSCMNGASSFEWHKRFKDGRESVGDDERWGRNKEVRTPELAKGLGLGLRLLCWGFKGVQEEIQS